MAPLFVLLRKAAAPRSDSEGGIATTKAAFGLAGLVGKIQEASQELQLAEVNRTSQAVASPWLLQTSSHALSMAGFTDLTRDLASDSSVLFVVFGFMLFFFCLTLVLLSMAHIESESEGRHRSIGRKRQSGPSFQTMYHQASNPPSLPGSPLGSPVGTSKSPLRDSANVRLGEKSIVDPHSPGFANTVTPDSDPLCSAFVVHDLAGMAIALRGAILPYRQDEVVEVVRDDNEQAILARIFLLEVGQDCGILVESMMRYPIAFLNTVGAVPVIGEQPPARRHVTIAKSFGKGDPVEPFAYVQDEHGKVVVRRGHAEGPVLYRIARDDGTSKGTIKDAGGREVAAVFSDGTGITMQAMPGADAGMILCAVVAERKLRN